MNIIGEVGSRIAILVDDMVDTAGTLVNAADAAIAAVETLLGELS